MTERFARRRAAEAFAGKQGPVLMGNSENIPESQRVLSACNETRM